MLLSEALRRRLETETRAGSSSSLVHCPSLRVRIGKPADETV